jgi:pyruvate formate lyase activating enzyme|tara:strand:- start:26 stop:937 length:912 start_codon:yes stop_codon:yes gene_type:complete
MNKALITKIVKDSILDGPGCRYVAFLKGCHLTCDWCHNPETQSKKQEIMLYPKFCIQCGKCLEKAPASHSSKEMPIHVDNKKLRQYRACLEACPTNALEYAAKEYTADEIITDMMKHKTVYQTTGGGITLSGGEPLLKKDFALDVFQQAQALGIHTTVDTTATLPWKTIAQLIPVVDLWLIDIKHTTDKAVQAKRAITNLLKLSKEKDVHIWVRMPIVPNYNDSESIWHEIATIVQSAGDAVEFVDLLPFHPYGSAKYKALNMTYLRKDTKPLNPEILENAKAIFDQHLPSEKVRMGREMVNG